MTDDKLNIAQFIDTFYPHIDGVISVTNHYAKRLNVSDKCTVIAPAPQKKKYVDDSPYEVMRCKSITVPVLKLDCALPKIDYKLKKRLKDGGYDIFHAHSPFNMGKYALYMSKKLDIPIVSTFHTKYYDDFKKILKIDVLANGFLKNIIRFYHNVDEVWTVNHNMVETLKEYGFKGDAYVMDNGTEYDYPNDAAQLKNDVNKIYKIDPNETVLVFVGQMIFQKNIKLIINSAKILKDKGVSFRLFMVGTGYNEKYIKDYTQELGLSENVIYTGKIADRNLLSGIYLRSSLLLFPSLYDASSIVLIEAAAHKLPGVLINGATTAEKIIDGHNGFLTQNTPESFSDKIISLLNDNNTIIKAGENAYQELYVNWDSIICKAKERYKYVIEKYHAEKETTAYKKKHTWT
jgi:glycosyltransferase involved in cell wall biosynthesis